MRGVAGSAIVRLAGGLTVLIGAANASFGLLAVVSDTVTMDPGATSWLILLGLTTAAIGAQVLRGSRHALVTALTIFGLLLVVELGRLASVPEVDPGSMLRVGILVLLVVTLALALRRSRTAV